MRQLRQFLALGMVAMIGAALALFDPLATPPLDDAIANPNSLPGYNFPIDAPLSGWGDPRLQRRPGEEALVFARRVTQVVSETIYHCEDLMRGNLIATITEHWTRFNEIGVISPAYLRCGYCHQLSAVLAEVLRRGGIDATVMGLDGHVVTQFIFDGKTYFTDADAYIGPFEADPQSADDMRQKATTAYADLADRIEQDAAQEWIAAFVDYYASTDNNVEFHNTSFLQKAENAQRITLFIIMSAPYLGYLLLGFVALWTTLQLTRPIRRRIFPQPQSLKKA